MTVIVLLAIFFGSSSENKTRLKYKTVTPMTRQYDGYS